MKIRKEEFIGALAAIASIFLLLSLLSFTANDLSFFVSRPNESVSNFTGIIGAYLASSLFFLIGKGAFSIPILIFFWIGALLFLESRSRLAIRVLCLVLFLMTISAFFSALSYPNHQSMFDQGGMVGFLTSSALFKLIGSIGAYFILFSITLLSFLVATEFLIFPLTVFAAKHIAGGIIYGRDYLEKRKLKYELPQEKNRVINTYRPGKLSAQNVKVKVSARDALTRHRDMAAKNKTLVKEEIVRKPRPPAKEPEREISTEEPRKDREKEEFISKVEALRDVSPPREEKQEKKPEPAPEKPRKEEVPLSEKEEETAGGHGDEFEPYELPSLDFLVAPPLGEERITTESLDATSAILEDTFKDFGIDVRVVKVDQGPVITRYELELASGVKVNRITGLSDDIALAMKAESVRIMAPIPGKAAVGIEVPNTAGTVTVYMRELLTSNEFKKNTSRLAIALGKTVSGKSIITDLADMPHLLIAGTTGAGKTVCVNVLIASILYHASPDEVKFIMIDPKMVELSVYNDIPHLLIPVVTEPKKASAALTWAVAEMENRYKMLARIGARNIDTYNKKVAAEDRSDFKKLPFIVIIIDELADLMLVAQNEVEASIARLAQMSRAVGIHIVLATQRPSVDVITGVIKANFPARISFKVASKVDSRTVLDMMGAEKLLGKGDMLFLQPGREKPIRIQGALLADKEIEKIIEYVASQRKPKFNEDIVKMQKQSVDKSNMEKDDCYEDALEVILTTRQASVSMLQRKLKLGYQRAARIIDMMEEEGLIGPHQGSKPREILVEDNYLSEYVSEESEEQIEEGMS